MLVGGTGDGLDDLQRVLVDCCTAADPVQALARALAAARSSGSGLATWLQTIDPEGLRLSAVLIRKLRFERIVRGDADLGARFAADPPGFTAAFRDYLETEPPRALFPEAEAAQFRRFLARSGR